VNLGALTTNSDLKNTYGKISVKIGRKSIDSGETKVGVFLGDMSKTAIGSFLNSGRKVGVGSHVFGTVSDDVPSFTMYGKSLGSRSAEIFLESVLSTQKRMMERRGLQMTEAMISLIRSVYKMTKGERGFQRVAKTRFKLR
jgi:glucose-1-phosphate thymidylyltransferase